MFCSNVSLALVVDLQYTTKDRLFKQSLSVADVADYVFALNGGRPASRKQRLSATRAAHRLLRRMKDVRAQHSRFINEAHRAAEAAFGRKPKYGEDGWEDSWREYGQLCT